MRNSIKKISAVFAACVLLFIFSCAGTVVFAQKKEVYIGGMPAGFTMGLGGAQIVGVCEILTEDGTACPARQADLAVGDMILSYGGIKIDSAVDIDSALAVKGGGCAEVIILRDHEEIQKEIRPVKDIVCGKYKLGVLIRDSVSGIGTVTYIEKGTLRFGSLGHAVADESGEPMRLNAGSIYRCSIVNVIRGERGKAGELKGLFLNDKGIAIADTNCGSGIFGNFEKDYDFTGLESAEISFNAQPGSAVIYTTVDGITPQKYSIQIVKSDITNRQNKNFVIRITDKNLLDVSGGIVQGMSGSPILQDGKLVGAVTHVFLNDPTRGYGISIKNMLGN